MLYTIDDHTTTQNDDHDIKQVLKVRHYTGRELALKMYNAFKKKRKISAVSSLAA